MHYNNLVVKVWLKVEVGSRTHTTVSLLYTQKIIRENIFHQGKIREFHFWISVATLQIYIELYKENFKRHLLLNH